VSRRLLAATTALCLALAAPAAFAATPDETPVETRHAIQLGGKALNYVAETGRIAIRDVETGEPHGWMFYVAYRVPSSKPRPVTFVWNGGPGANSSTLHFELVGPKRAEGDHLADNPDTWLADTDLVFVDPIGTGFSRPTKAEYGDEFYGTVGDVASVAEFVRAWLLDHDADGSPLYLAGESWGAGRAGSVGYALEHRGIKVSGLVLISGGAGLHKDYVAPSMAAALRVVDLAGEALYHGKTAPELRKDPAALHTQAEAWARQTYAPALARVNDLTDAERDAIAAQLSKFTGISADQIDRKTLIITPRQFRSGLLKAEGKTLNVFDVRLTAEPHEAAGPAILRYMRRDLGYHTDLPYVGLEGDEAGYAPNGVYPASVNERWNYATAKVSPEEMKAAIAEASRKGGGPPVLGPPLPSTAEAIALDPNLKVLVVAGRYDSLNSCAGNDEIARDLPPELAKSIRFKCYTGGHMMYRDAETRVELAADVKAMISGR
jgi:carboxypeptidase C (cathepsin A)